MVIVGVIWASAVGTDIRMVDVHAAHIRDPERRGDFVCGVLCNEFGVASRTEGCNEDAELRIRRNSILFYEEAVL